MLFWQPIRQTAHRIRKLPLKAIIPICAALFFVVFYSLAFFTEKSITFSYAGQTCANYLALFPSTMQSEESREFSLEQKRIVKIAGVSLFSREVCFTPKTAPQEGVTRVTLSPWGGPFARKSFVIRVGEAPRVDVRAFAKPIPAGKPLALPLDTHDAVHSYDLVVNDKRAGCKTQSSAVVCSLESLQLAQGKPYVFEVEKLFKQEKVATLVSKKAMTLPATKITKAAITQGKTIYERPKAFVFEFDKEVKLAEAELQKIEGNRHKLVSTTVTVRGKKVTVAIDKELDRLKDYSFQFTTFEALDGSTLAKPYKAHFKVSGGPKITGSNIGRTGAGLSQTVVLTFDQPLSEKQDFRKFVTTKGLSASIAGRGNQLLVSYVGAAKCADFTIAIAKGLESKFGIAQTNSQAFSSRTVCHTVQTIGYSKEGRAINAYFFGNGSRTILFTGAIHGNEKSSKYIMDNWINELEAKAKAIPREKQIVIVPVVNPDGFYKYGRFNANGVNLNRNWPTYNWTKDPETSPGKVEPGVGGSAPLSEPETRVLAAFTRQINPYFVATYHSQGNIVNSNDVGKAFSVGKNYAAMTGYQFVADAQTTETFGVVVTGTYEDWLKERGTAAILMELNTNTGYHFAQNRAAMWMLLGI